MGEDVVHHILALRIVVQKYGGQPIHLTVMLSKQLFEFTLICHTLLIHMKTELLNPLWLFFCKVTELFGIRRFLLYLCTVNQDYETDTTDTQIISKKSRVPRAYMRICGTRGNIETICYICYLLLTNVLYNSNISWI